MKRKRKRKREREEEEEDEKDEEEEEDEKDEEEEEEAGWMRNQGRFGAEMRCFKVKLVKKGKPGSNEF